MNSSLNPHSSKCYKILYVGASHSLVCLLRQKLKTRGCQVVRCPDGWQARLFLQSSIPYDILIFDQNVSGLSRSELCALIRLLSHRQVTPVLLRQNISIEYELAYDLGLVRTIEQLLGIDKVEIG